MSTEPIPVTPAVVVIDGCTVETVPMDGLSYSLLGTVDAVVITAIPDEGYLIVPDLAAGWQYDPHAATASLVVPCNTATLPPVVEETAAPVVPPPIDVLPATGARDGNYGPALLLLCFALVCVGLALIIWGGRRRG